VVEDLERRLALAHGDREGVVGAPILDADEHEVVDLAPQQLDLQAVADPRVQLAHRPLLLPRLPWMFKHPGPHRRDSVAWLSVRAFIGRFEQMLSVFAPMGGSAS
jgi:hypothetical protein